MFLISRLLLLQASGGSEAASHSVGFAAVLRLLLRNFLQCYRCSSLLAWSAWWALATCGYLQIVNYAQALWEAVRSSKHNSIYNGYVDTIATLLGGKWWKLCELDCHEHSSGVSCVSGCISNIHVKACVFKVRQVLVDL